MKTPLIALFLGLAFVLSTISFNMYQRRIHHEDVRGIAALREALASARLAPAAARTGSDSARLTEQIRAREGGLAEREYHVPRRQLELERWWQPTGLGSILVTFGTVLVVGSLAWLRRRKSGAA